MTGNDVFAARFSPGFSRDLTYWRVFVGRNRWLRQEVVITNLADRDQDEILRYQVHLSRPQMAHLWDVVERIGFRQYERRLTHKSMCVTDSATFWITVRFGDRTKEVEAYDLHHLAEIESQPAAIGLMELWNAIHQRAPHGKVPVEEGRAKPWWRIW